MYIVSPLPYLYCSSSRLNACIVCDPRLSDLFLSGVQYGTGDNGRQCVSWLLLIGEPSTLIRANQDRLHLGEKCPDTFVVLRRQQLCFSRVTDEGPRITGFITYQCTYLHPTFRPPLQCSLFLSCVINHPLCCKSLRKVFRVFPRTNNSASEHAENGRS